MGAALERVWEQVNSDQGDAGKCIVGARLRENNSFRGAKGDNGRVREPGGCCVIVFRSAKGLRIQNSFLSPSERHFSRWSC